MNGLVLSIEKPPGCCNCIVQDNAMQIQLSQNKHLPSSTLLKDPKIMDVSMKSLSVFYVLVNI